jgi:TRAP-type transport system periplasmic protein
LTWASQIFYQSSNEVKEILAPRGGAMPLLRQRLPKTLQELVDHEFNSAAAAASTAMATQEVSIEATLRSRGVTFNRPGLDPFRAILRGSGLYSQWRERFDPKGWDAVEKTTGTLV